MKAVKYTLTISAEALSIDSFKAMLYDVTDQLDREHIMGEHCADDGDCVGWNIEKKPVEI